MNKFDKFVDETVEAIDANTVASTTAWKDRIVEFLMDNQGASTRDILEATDPNFTGDNFTKRKHCLDSQITYARQDYNLVIQKQDDKYLLRGVIKDKKLHTFLSASEYLSK